MMEVQAGGRISIKTESKTKFTFEIANVNMSDEREYEVTITSSGLNVTISSLAKVTVIRSNSSTPPTATSVTYQSNPSVFKIFKLEILTIINLSDTFNIFCFSDV